MNTYIQNKLDEFDDNKFFNILNIPIDKVYAEKDGLRFDLQEINIKEIIKQSLTDYHNHIVDIIDGQTIIATDDTQFGLHTDGYNNAIEDILSLLQDTNLKE